MMHVTMSLLAAMALGAALGLTAGEGNGKPDQPKEAPSMYQFTVRNIDGEEVSLAKYRGQVCLIVNVASR